MSKITNVMKLFENYDEEEREIIVGEGIRQYEVYRDYFAENIESRGVAVKQLLTEGEGKQQIPKELQLMNQKLTEFRRENEIMVRELEQIQEMKEREMTMMEKQLREKEKEIQYEREQVRRMREVQQEESQRMMKQKEDHYMRMMGDLKAMYEETMKQLQKEKEQQQNQLNRMVEMMKEMIEEGITKRTEQLKKRVGELELENRRYYELYESREKGLAFEEEIERALNEYNTMNLGGIWDIKRVGQLSGGGKGDFILRQRETGLTVLIDTKNNIPTSAVSRDDVMKFITDVNEKHDLVNAGIMLARNNISNRKRFQVDENGMKPLLYVSQFEVRHIGFIFSLMEYVGVKLGGDTIFNKQIYKEKLQGDYQFIKKQMGVYTEQLKILEMKQMEIVNEYKIHFEEDIMIAIDTREQTKKVGNRRGKQLGLGVAVRTEENKIGEEGGVMKINSVIPEEGETSFEEKEEGKKVKGKRSKYYLMYVDEKEGEVIQYFRNNFEKEKKRDILLKKESVMINMTIST